MLEALAHLLQLHAGRIVEVQKRLTGFLKAVQHALDQDDGVDIISDIISVHHAEEAATEDPQGRVWSGGSISFSFNSDACTSGGLAGTSGRDLLCTFFKHAVTCLEGFSI